MSDQQYGQSHSFDIAIATHFQDCEVAIVYNHIFLWIKYNKSKKKNFINGKTWSFSTIAEIAENLPYISERKVKTCLQLLVDEQFLIRDFHDDNPFNRTPWYALPDEENLNFKKIITKGQKLSGRADKNCPMQETKIVPCEQTKIVPSIIDTGREHVGNNNNSETPVVVVSSIEEKEIAKIIAPVVFDSGVLKQLASLPIEQIREAHKAYLQYAESHEIDNPSGFLRKAITEAWKPRQIDDKLDKQSKLEQLIEKNKAEALKLIEIYKPQFKYNLKLAMSTHHVDTITPRGGNAIGYAENNFLDLIQGFIKHHFTKIT